MKFRNGMRRLALVGGVLGLIVCGFYAMFPLGQIQVQRAHHSRFEQLASSEVVQKEHACLLRGNGGGSPIIQGENSQATVVNKGTIKSIIWKMDKSILAIETDDGDLVPATEAVSVWQYAPIGLLLLLGFIAPWGFLRAVEWVACGFMKKHERREAPVN